MTDRTEQKLSSREQKIFEWLCDELSKQNFLRRKKWSDFLAGKDFTATYATSDFESLFFCKNDFYCPPSKVFGIVKSSKCIIYGYGKSGKSLVNAISCKKNIVAIYDNNSPDAERPPDRVSDYPVFDYIIVAVILPTFQRQIIRELLDLGVPREKILCPFVIDENHQYFDDDIIKMVRDEIFIDGGSFDFSASRRLLQKNKSVLKIFAYEPDSDNFYKTCQSANSCGFKNIEIRQRALWSSETTLYWESHGASSRIGASEGIVVKTETIDDAVQDEKVTFIKMDLEGSEMEALKGARRTIMRCRPKLAISIYHKPNDYYEIAEYIKSLVPEYRAYIRHYSSGSDDTVLYCI